MYTSFYNLTKKPFQISSDPEFMWFGEKHKEALATLKYGILDNKGFLLLTGDVGTGKTTLINALLKSLDDDIICTSVPDPGLEKMDFFNFISAAFGIEGEFATKGKFLTHFRNFLTRTNEEGKKVLLIIDEAQLLTQEMLEEIRLLSNIEKMDAKLINIFFVGQNEFNEILNREQNRAVRQRLTLNYNIDPLTPDETAEYISHRLKVAGATRAIFDTSATQEVFMYSGGFPRRINVICDHSLLSGYVQEKQVISASMVAECAKELKIPAHIRNRDINGFASYHEKKSRVPKSDPDPEPITKPVRQQTVVPKKTPIEERPSEERGGSRFLKGVVFIVIVLTICFWFFPKEFNLAVNIIEQQTTQVRQRIAAALPEPYASILFEAPIRMEQEPDKKNTEPEPHPLSPVMESKPVFTATEKTVEKKSEDKKKTNESSQKPVNEIKPIQSNVLETKDAPLVKKENEIPARGQQATEDLKNQKRDESSVSAAKDTAASDVKTEQEPAGRQLEIQKEILQLPDEKLIIRFQYNTNDLTPEAYSKLVTFSTTLVMHPEAKVRVTGYTDSDGYQQYNRKLSEFRANIVRSFLLGRGIRPEQVSIRGLGSLNPIESNDTAKGRMLNRRVEIEVIE